MRYELRKRSDVGHQENQDADEAGQDDAVPEDEAQDLALVPVPFGGGAGDHDALSVDHLSHNAASAVGCAHQDGGDSDLLGGDFLQTAEEHVGRGV